jgi:hypothetical protein
MASGMNQRLTLGSVNFFGFEVPEELPNLFGTQKVAIHDAAGGDRTVQILGSFPFDFIEWKGIFFNNDTIGAAAASPGGSAQGTAIQRASLLNTYKVTGQTQTLVWGSFQYDVVVHEFEIIGKLQQELMYRIKVIPIFDYTTTSNTSPTPMSATGATFDANQGVTNATTSATGLLLPPLVIAAAAIITTAVTSAIINVNGNVTNVSNTTQASLQAQIAALQTTLTPIINGADYGQATAAATLSSALFTLSATLGINQAVPIATITVTDPNLPQLAAQYYNNSTLWPLIASANNLQDILPIGTFNLVIPPNSTQSSLIPAS